MNEPVSFYDYERVREELMQEAFAWKARAEKAEAERDKLQADINLLSGMFCTYSAIQHDKDRAELSTLRSKLSFTADGEPVAIIINLYHCFGCSSHNEVFEHQGRLFVGYLDQNAQRIVPVSNCYSTPEARDEALTKERKPR